MPTYPVKPGPFHIAPYGKLLVAHAMLHKGTQFVGAAILLRQKNGYPDVVLHLLAQGLEIVQKGILLAKDYDRFRPQLKKLGHNLVRGSDALESACGFRPMPQKLKAELQAISGFYGQHVLRYASIHDLFGGPIDVPTDGILRRTVVLIRWGNRFIARQKRALENASQGKP